MKMLWSVPLILALVQSVSAQEEPNADWQIMPSVVVLKFFPGEKIREMSSGMYMPTYPAMVPVYNEFNYSGTGVNFSARCFSDDIQPLALTFSGGITWYYQPKGTFYALTAPTQSGVGAVLGRQDFTAFPVSIGAQVVFPYASREKLMVFAGAEGNLHFVSGNLAINQQAKAGYTVLGGFAVKFLEFGIRYTAFSDIKNLGAYFGLRFKSFGI
jgi:hypothetical protein